MHEIICPHCGKAFKIDEAGYPCPGRVLYTQIAIVRPGSFRCGSVSSLMLEAAVRLLDAATVSNPPHC
jgi:hypothetical protein